MERRDDYEAYLKPYLYGRLKAVGLDVEYHRAKGDCLYYYNGDGAEIEVLDIVGGFGSSLLGHNHPEIVSVFKESLDDSRAFVAQGSIRREAATLARRLSDRIGSFTKRGYVVTLANSGAEAIEAAIKHAEFERHCRIEAILDRVGRTFHVIRKGIREQSLSFSQAVFDEVARALNVDLVDDLDDCFFVIRQAIGEVLDRPPLLLAIDGSFHGKTGCALQLTQNRELRLPWSRIGPEVVFLSRESTSHLHEALESSFAMFPELVISKEGSVDVIENRFSRVAAIFVEPIQGEGGIRCLSARYLQELRLAADQNGFPLVVDEIQSGMGRTGAFLASEHSGVRGDYYTLAKTMGGGLCKAAALAVDKERYIDEFGYLHTSTYAEDDYSSAVANKVLDILERDNGSFIQMCKEKGDYLLCRLEKLAEKYPDQLLEVRGRGLMVGVEFVRQAASKSALLQVLSEQDRLGLFLCGYLLAEERIRALPTLSAGHTLRLQPSAFIQYEELDHLCDALERLLVALKESNAYVLTRHLVGRKDDAKSQDVLKESKEKVSADKRWTEFHASQETHVGFLGHFLNGGDLRLWDSGLSAFSDDDCKRFLERTGSAIEPFVVDRTKLSSALGTTVKATIIGIPFTPAQALASLRTGQDEIILEQINKGVNLARRMGCSVLGFGGYTSILTRNCESIVASDIAITSGNSLTVAAAVDATLLACRRLCIDRKRVGIIGAAGNIGMVLAQVMLEEADEIVLVGQPRAIKRLNRNARQFYCEAWSLARIGKRSGLALCVSNTKAFAAFEKSLQDEAGSIEQMLEELSVDGPISVHADMLELQQCNIIFSASNAATAILMPEHISKREAVVVCDVAVPQDVDQSVLKERPNATVLAGGMIYAPLGQRLSLQGLPLQGGEIYGCLAETLLLGLCRMQEDFSYGPLMATQVRRARELAGMHGFVIRENQVQL